METIDADSEQILWYDPFDRWKELPEPSLSVRMFSRVDAGYMVGLGFWLAKWFKA